ncbi:MAG: hypothetical protein AAGE98_05645 [Actinomycetota bacterium]
MSILRSHTIRTVSGLMLAVTFVVASASAAAAAEGVPETAGRGLAEYVAIAIGTVVFVIGLLVAQVRRNRAAGETADPEPDEA